MKNKKVELALINNSLKSNAETKVLASAEIPNGNDSVGVWGFVDTDCGGYGIGFRQNGIVLTKGEGAAFISLDQIEKLISGDSEIISGESVKELLDQVDDFNQELDALDHVIDEIGK